MSWEKTWLYRFRDVYLVPWKLNDEAIRVEEIPARAFDTPEERERVAAILEPYNNDLTLTAEEEASFAELARERTARHPLRTYVWLPTARAVTMWFTPRIELIPVSGTVFPLSAVVAGRQDRSVGDGGIISAEHPVRRASDLGRGAIVAAQRVGATSGGGANRFHPAAHGVSYNPGNSGTPLRFGLLPGVDCPSRPAFRGSRVVRVKTAKIVSGVAFTHR